LPVGSWHWMAKPFRARAFTEMIEQLTAKHHS
jgi:hypothetical protein